MPTVEVEKTRLANARLVCADDVPLAPGQARLKVESFAVTANNVTYAVIGDAFGYWNFFPASQDGWGVVPMWGHALVEESAHPELSAGERVYGYLPMASHLVVDAGKVSASGFADIAAHRQPMSPIYNQYSRLAADPEHDPDREDARMIFGPLFKTGFLIETMFRGADWFGAGEMVMTSASSKTALALAHCARAASPGIRRIGLTSEANLAFVNASGLYDQVVSYGARETLSKAPSVSVDFAGSGSVLRAIHERLGDDLKYSCLVGATHVGDRGGQGEPMSGPAPILFFAPDHARLAIEQLGPKAFGQAVAKSWNGFVDEAQRFVSVVHHEGLEQAMETFSATLAGQANPARGIVIRP